MNANEPRPECGIIRNWTGADSNGYSGIRCNTSAVQSLLKHGYCFKFSPEFSWDVFLEGDATAHAYLAHENGGNQNPDQWNPEDMRLVLVSRKGDDKIAKGNGAHVKTIVSSYVESDSDNLDSEKIRRWKDEYETWVEEVNEYPCEPDISNGMTVAFEVPMLDILGDFWTSNDDNKNLEVYFGLRKREHVTTVGKQIDLITYHPQTHQILPLIANQDFTSPKPPWGSQDEKDKYGLLKNCTGI